MIGAGHVARDVRLRVAVRPQDLLAGRVERDRGLDLLTAADPAAGHEVADGARLGRREGLRAVVGGRRLRARRAAAARPVVAVVAVEVGPDRARARVRLAVLAPGAVGRTGEVVFGAVGVDREDDPDLAAVDDVGDPLVGAVAIRQPAQDRQRLLEREVLAGVVESVEHDLGLGLVGRDVVGDLGDPQVAAPVALADRAERDDVRMGGLGGRGSRRPSRRRCGTPSRRPGSRRRRPRTRAVTRASSAAAAARSGRRR